MKRFFDVVLSLMVLLLLLPLFLLCMIVIVIESPGGAIYRQTRVGKNNIDFKLLKFRTMKKNADKQGLLTVGYADARVTPFGYLLRRAKFDEFPQLLNIIKGDMSIVGPRPEVRKYVDMYNEDQRQVLAVRPGLTDYASLVYIHENDILAAAQNPEEKYINEIMPHKIKLNLQYIQNQSVKEDFQLIFKTLYAVVSPRK
ncbi:MAG: sugar transferase [Bacteroidales bacterium]|nr:sugar transferase [Bacteroidales bacterium]